MISVIVPVYNVEKYVEMCIGSIRNQSYRDIEIILVDDGSTDGSGEICDKHAKEDNRISVIHKPNGGLVSARKAGANIASGEYIASVDGDDWIERDYIENFAKEIEACKADIICSVSHIKDYGDYSKLWLPEYIEKLVIETEDAQEQLLQMVLGVQDDQRAIDTNHWLRCIRCEIYREAQNNVDEKIIYGEDTAFTIICHSLTQNIRFIRNDGYHYIQRESSIIRNRERYSIEEDEILLQNLMNYFEKAGINPVGLKRQAYRAYIRGRVLHDIGSLQNSASDFLYPYRKVKKGSRLVLFGAGAIGRSIMAYLSKTKDYIVVAWIDSNVTGSIVDGWVIGSIEDLALLTYDYIVLATTKAAYSWEMKSALMERGIAEDKIGEMSQE